MALNAIDERDLRRRLSIPPTFDVAGHLRNLRHVFVPALVGALLIAGAVYVYAAARPARFESVVVAKIDVGATTSLTDVTVNTLAPPFVALAQSRPVLQDVIKRTGVRTTPEDLAKDVTVSVQTSPSLVQVTARAGSPEDAVALSGATVAALDDAIVNIWIDKVTKDVADLQASASDTSAKMGSFPQGSPPWDVLKGDYDSQVERARQLQTTPPTRIGLLSQPFTATEIAPLPAQQTSVAFIVALLVLMEALAVLDGRLGRRSNIAWLRRQAARHGYAMEDVQSSARAWPTTAQILVNQAASSGLPMVVLRSEKSSASTSLITHALDVEQSGAEATVKAIEADWWRDTDIADRALAIVVVDTTGETRPALARTFDALDDYGLPVHVVALVSRDRGPRFGRLRDALTRNPSGRRRR